VRLGREESRVPRVTVGTRARLEHKTNTIVII